MTAYPNTYPAPRPGRQDWSGEITTPPHRPPSDTGFGGMEGQGAAAAPVPAPSSGGSSSGFSGGPSGGRTMTSAGASGGTGFAALPGGWGANAPAGAGLWQGSMSMGEGGGNIGADIENNLPPDEIGAPDSLEEVFLGSMKALLLRNIGNYVVATFLIGTQGTVSWEGILYSVGNDYLAIYQTGRDQYIVCDLYSLKYVEFYDNQRREMCDALLSEREAASRTAAAQGR